ncbi:MAG TPA: hypothetical protein PKK95_10735 [Vicinamibacterales bacterium]|nr:hypothetical protein [Acidobacteriota bacterium]HOC18737.1 hypothetical protein [Vicinamibacterales bacterium]
MRTAILAVLLAAFAAAPAHAQSIAEHARGVALDVLKDPTTYAPAAASEIGKTLDWVSSQRFFAAGYVEANPHYTISGLPHDRPVSRATGHRLNLEVSLRVLGYSAANNAINHAATRALSARFPQHKRLIRIASIVERAAFAVGTGYLNSAKNFRQWRKNVNAPIQPVGALAW